MKTLILLLFPFLTFAQLHIKRLEPKEIKEGQNLQFQLSLDEKPENVLVVWEMNGSIQPSMKLSPEGMFTFQPDYKTVGKNEGSKTFQLDIKAKVSNDTIALEDITTLTINVLNANTAPKVPRDAELVWIEKPNEEVTKSFQPQYYRDEENDELAFRLLTRKYPNVSLSPSGELKVALSSKERKSLPDTLVFEVFEVNTDEALATKQKIVLQKAEKDEAPTITFSPATEKFQLSEEEVLDLKVTVEDANDDLKSVEFYTNPQGKMKPADFMKKAGETYLFTWKPNLDFVSNDMASKSFFLVVTATDEAKMITVKQVEVEILNKIDWKIEDSIRTADYQKHLTDAFILLASLEPQLDELAKEFKKKHKNKELLSAFSTALSSAQDMKFNASTTSGSGSSNAVGNVQAISSMGNALFLEPDYQPIQRLIEIIPKLYTESCIFSTKYKRLADRRTPEFIQSQEQFLGILSEARFAVDDKKKPKKIEVNSQLIQQRFGAY